MTAASPDETALLPRLESVLGVLAAGNRFALAYSGGLDSRFLAHAAQRFGFEPVLLHIVGPHIPPEETDYARHWAASRELAYEELPADPLDLALVASGDRRRCYACKRNLFSLLKARTDLPLCDGTNASDAGQYRPGIRAVEELGILSPLASAGLTQDDVTLVEMDANGMVSAMVSGGVDACATWSPSTLTIANALGDKALTLATNNDYVDQVTFPSSFITTEEFANANHDVLVRFSRALLKAQDYRAANIEEVAKWVAKQCKADEQTMLDCVGEGNWLTGEFIAQGLKDGTVKNYYQNQQKVFIDAGRITEEVPVEDYILFDVMQEAVDATYGA